MHAKHPKLVGAAGGRPGSSHRVGPTSAAFWVVLALLVTPLSSSAESWCAYPIWAHEWGVQVFGGAKSAPLPLSFAHDSTGTVSEPTPVRDMDVDSGVRALPVVSFFAPQTRFDTVPIGLEVGFSAGKAALWFPQVDTLVDAATANAATALDERQALLDARAKRDPYGENPVLGADPTRQLVWETLSLEEKGKGSEKSTQTWVDALRKLDGALWVERGAESERFAFYEGRTDEKPLLEVERGDEWSDTRAHYVLKNPSAWPVHDVLVVRRVGKQAYVFYAPSIPAGKSAGFVLEDALQVGSDAFKEATRGQLEKSLVDATTPTPPTDYDWSTGTCVMGRDPAVPVEVAEGHRLYQAEVDVLLDAWGPAFFEQEGTVVVYREDPGYLDAMMPLSLYTDMYHFIELRRAGLVLWTDAQW